jgi:hypothetical protein
VTCLQVASAAAGLKKCSTRIANAAAPTGGKELLSRRRAWLLKHSRILGSIYGVYPSAPFQAAERQAPALSHRAPM